MLVFLQFGQWWWENLENFPLGMNETNELRKLNKLRNMQLSSLVDIPTYQHHLSLYQSKVTTPSLGGAASSEEQLTNMISTELINIIFV